MCVCIYMYIYSYKSFFVQLFRTVSLLPLICVEMKKGQRWKLQEAITVIPHQSVICPCIIGEVCRVA